MSLQPFLHKVLDNIDLSTEEAQTAFGLIMSGQTGTAVTAAFLIALRQKGETVDEIAGAASVMREKATPVTAPENAIDTCGTGGDGKGTLNISSAAALLVAACGVPVAKHGNRNLSSKSGSAQVLACLGVNIDADTAKIEQSVVEAGVGFMMAPRHHGAMRHVGPIRVELGTRTIFNLLGPLSNPAGTKRQLIGVFAKERVEPLARVLGQLGAEKAWVVHGGDGLDELTTTTTSYVAEYVQTEGKESGKGEVRTFTVDPRELGIPLSSEGDLAGGEPDFNAAAIERLLAGEKSAYRDIVALNTAAALVVADKAGDLQSGLVLAYQAIDSGRAKAALDKMVEITNG